MRYTMTAWGAPFRMVVLRVRPNQVEIIAIMEDAGPVGTDMP